MPQISIVLPIYNVEKYLKRCLDSILAQTFSDFELICVNDGSPDGCGAILSDYALKDKRISVITQQNQGLCVARNNGLKKAVGEYVILLDSDDCIHPQLLEISYHLAEKHNADMVCFQSKHNNIADMPVHQLYDLNKIQAKITTNPLFFTKRRKKYQVSLTVYTKLYKRAFIQDTPFIPGIYYEDYPHEMELFGRHPKAVLINEALYYFTINENSLTHAKLTPKYITDCHTGMKRVFDIYQNATKKELNVILHSLFPNLLKQQLNRILRSPKEKQPVLFQAFQIELRDLNDKGCISFWHNKLKRYLIYRRLIKGEDIQ